MPRLDATPCQIIIRVHPRKSDSRQARWVVMLQVVEEREMLMNEETMVSQ